ncbi:WXG100 family type VII secretion target [Kitasatospora sp. NPDC090091]|uniref:WXG100 family type VII secretion target n=1 Tax=Kitasatospora sp. NPDC090091 TaxID=3364081 RepID=UPI003803C3C6
MAGGTNFEAKGHEQLRAMVASADPSKVLSRGSRLKSAGEVLKELSAALKSHVDQIQWEGPAGEAFKAWAGNFHKSGAALAEYSIGVGDAIHQAGEALSTAKTAVPELPKTEIATVSKHKNQSVPYLPSDFEAKYGVGSTVDSVMKQANPNWVTGAEAAAAQKKVEQEHQEAINQMVKLGQAYDAVATKLNALETPAELKPPGSNDNRGGLEEVGGGGSGGTGSGGTVRTPHGGVGGGGGSYSPPGNHGGGGGSVTPLPRTPGPDGPNQPGRIDPVPPHNGPTPLPPTPSPGPAPVPVIPDRPGTDLNSLPPVTTLPNQTGPIGPGVPGSLPPSYPGGQQGYPNGPGGGPAFPGTGPLPFGPSGGSVPLKGTGPTSGRTSTFGGGNVPSKNGTPGTPGGGPVFGQQPQTGQGGRSTAGGGGMGGGMHPGAGGHGGGGASGGSARGRGLTSFGGGTVGGRSGPKAGGEFTPGGTGLRNRSAAGAGGAGAEGGARSGQNGMMGAPGTSGGPGKNERDRRKRADYLHEDEETWTSGTPRSNPDVIE